MAEGDSEISFPKGPAEVRLDGGDNLGVVADQPSGNLSGLLQQSEDPLANSPIARGNAMSTPDLSPADLTPHRAHMVVKPEKFDGKGDWAEYISHFNDCAELGGWDNKAKCLVLAANLRDAARKYYTGLGADEKKDYDRLVTALRRRFGGEHRQDSWLSKLEMRKRKHGESVADLGDDIWQMTQRAYYDFDQRSQEQLALKYFYRVVDADMKVKCVENHCSTIADAVDVVERYEALYEDKREGRRSGIRAVETQKPQVTSADINKVLTKLEKLEARQVEQQAQLSQMQGSLPSRGNDRRTTGCYQCGSPNHFIADCPQRTTPNQFNNRRPSFQPRDNQGRNMMAGNSRPSN